MKCDELKALVFSINDLAYIDEKSATKNFENVHDHAVYKATDVDAAIAELKAKLESEKESRYADSVDAGMENRRLKRALWMARAERAKWQSGYYWYAVSRKDDSRKFDRVERKCLKKSKEYL